MDINDFELVDSRFILQTTNGVTPNQPLIHFDLKSVNTYSYTERVKTERYIQRYRPRLGYMLLGAAAAGISYYAAFSDQLLTQPTDPQRYSLIGAGTILTGLSFMNMKPVGEPTKTGESRLLRKTGTTLQTDTLEARPYNTKDPAIKITYKGKTLVENNSWNFNRGRITINLSEEIDAGIFEDKPTDPVRVDVRYDTLSQSKDIPVTSIFEQFVVVESPITALRNEKSFDRNNILTDLASGSQLQLVSKEGEWVKVLYGISENWVAAKDVRTIWRPSEFATNLSVVTVPNVPFGSVDVERNIPVLGRSPLNSSAFIISNSEYEGDITERTYGQRDAKLMEEYFIQALGVRDRNIVKATNVSSDRQLQMAYNRLVSSFSEEGQNVKVYINGFAEIREGNVYLLASEQANGENQYLDLNKLFRGLSTMKVNSLLIFADLDFRNNNGSLKALENLASHVTSGSSRTAVFFSSRPDQRSNIYSSANGPQNRHSIFTYFLAQAMKQRKMSMNEIQNHLERNVPFTSRSLYERPQNPLFFGNAQLELLN